MDNPTRNLGAEIDGRLMALELLITVLLSERTDHDTVLSKVEGLLASLQAQLAEMQPEDHVHTSVMFERAREVVDGIGLQIRFARGATR